MVQDAYIEKEPISPGLYSVIINDLEYLIEQEPPS